MIANILLAIVFLAAVIYGGVLFTVLVLNPILRWFFP